ncbi:uncharacterized protein I303_107833 [Kwoniella dejecticola CBS 10117]|uniref:Spp2/MOS2 G-patch domain-containing protein n=1 Tax=Kwoniella dejecticola CBS 10117 TaxID=1296121 RepID=A0A1A5ZVU9_9TREE|nr:uncharacterized protein I303_07837 [Kwoniella dejecticola CBS 10117]OBR81927.1 hypothetical protein I303_07837 [Kwoniella dejecticola CBS 10117]
MPQPISFTVRPPTSAPHRPSPLGNGHSRGAPSRRLFEQNGHDDDEDDDDEDHHGSRNGRNIRPREERIDGYRNGKAMGGEKPSGPLVIPSLPNRDWRASSSRTPSYRPETRDPNETIETHERTGDGPQRSGLRKLNDPTNYNDPYDKVKIETPAGNETSTGDVKREDSNEEEEDVKPVIPEEGGADVKLQTLDEQALQAILSGDVKTESEEERLRRELVIGGSSVLSEEEALKRDIDELPEVSTAEDYAAIPVSAFGEAMARGMGWNPNASGGTKIHEPKLRPALLGLGATALEKPLPPSRNGSTSSSANAKKPKISKKDSMKYHLGESMVKREKPEITSRASTSGSNTREGSTSRRPSPESDYSSSSKRRRDHGDDTRDRDRDGKRYETEEERARRKAKERERDRDRERGGREYETEEERARRKAKEREREYETD